MPHLQAAPQNQSAPQNPSISEMELALRWKKSIRTLLVWRTQGKLKGFKVGKSTRFLMSEIEAIERGEQLIKTEEQ
jgi:hypothetical protein